MYIRRSGRKLSGSAAPRSREKRFPSTRFEIEIKKRMNLGGCLDGFQRAKKRKSPSLHGHTRSPEEFGEPTQPQVPFEEILNQFGKWRDITQAPFARLALLLQINNFSCQRIVTKTFPCLTVDLSPKEKR